LANGDGQGGDGGAANDRLVYFAATGLMANGCFGATMPNLPSKGCKTPGCRGTAERIGFCRNCHADGKATDGRPSRAERGYDYRWFNYRRAFLAANPFCADPYRRHPAVRQVATVCDHKEPHRGNQELFWDRRNHQPLCKPCHDYKTATFDGGFGHERQRQPAAITGNQR
jgi:5-methylcytosine-specific restriction enzyme A